MPTHSLRIHHTREEIVNVFCEALTDHINKCKNNGIHRTEFNISIWYNSATGELSATHQKRWKHADGITPYRYMFKDYETEITDHFRAAGYHIEPAVNWNGLRRRTREISW